MRFRAILAACILAALPVRAGDWPEWRGAGRAGVWNETGLLERFPAEGLTFRWRTPIHPGYAGPSVAGGRVFVADFRAAEGTQGTERILALDQQTGKVLWTREWRADYAGIDHASGPRATPTVDGDRVYALGAAGRLSCLRADSGLEVWTRDFQSELGTELPPWGMTAAPIVFEDLVIAVAAGRPNAKVVAFDKFTGKEVWRALSSEHSGPGYSQPTIIHSNGRPALIVWHAGAVSALDPNNGETRWEQPFKVRMETPISTPVWHEPYLLVSSFFNGSRLYRAGGEGSRLLWKGTSDSEIRSDGLHALMSAPVIDGGYIYGVCSYGQLRCLRLATGERVWETQAVTVEKARNASAFIVRNGDRYFINNDRGELIIARLSPSGYEEMDRTKLIRPTSEPGARRELGAVNWSHPAYAGRSIFARNDEEIVCASLASQPRQLE